jgi:hypothetical protein
MENNLKGKVISPEEVNCYTLHYKKRNIKLDFGNSVFNRVGRGLEFFINIKDKFDILLLGVYLNFSKDFFGNCRICATWYSEFR